MNREKRKKRSFWNLLFIHRRCCRHIFLAEHHLPEQEVLFLWWWSHTEWRRPNWPSPHRAQVLTCLSLCVWWGAFYKSSRSVTVFFSRLALSTFSYFDDVLQVEEKDGPSIFWHVYYRTRDSYPPRHKHTRTHTTHETCKHSIYQFSPHVPTAKAQQFIYFLFIRFVSLMIRSNVTMDHRRLLGYLRYTLEERCSLVVTADCHSG